MSLWKWSAKLGLITLNMIDVIGLVWFNFSSWLISQCHNPDPVWQTFLNCKAHKRIFQHPLGWVLHLDKELHREMWLENNFIKWGKDWGITDWWVISGILGFHSLNLLLFIELNISSWLLMKDNLCLPNCCLHVQTTSSTIWQFCDYLESLKLMYDLLINNLITYFYRYITLRLWSTGLWHNVVLWVDVTVTSVTTLKTIVWIIATITTRKFYICIIWL